MTTTKNKSTSTKCPCDSGNKYFDCCKRYIEREATPPTALALMRSRYTAFTLLDESYLRDTWLPENCPKTIYLDKDDKWLGLKIISTTKGQAEDEAGEVEFVARCKNAGSKSTGKARRLHENSLFTKKQMRWLYIGSKQN